MICIKVKKYKYNNFNLHQKFVWWKNILKFLKINLFLYIDNFQVFKTVWVSKKARISKTDLAL